MQLGTFAAHIVIDGVSLKEYDIVFESPTKATCWIASEEGKLFGVQWRCHETPRITGTRGKVTLDGTSGGHRWMHPGTLGKDDTVTQSRFADSTATRDFMFTRVELSDDDSLLAKVIPKDFGQICLTIRRGRIHKKLRHVGEGYSKVLDDNKYHETSKKVTVHCVGFGPERQRTKIRQRYRRFLIPNNEPEISFVFKYQPLSVLQANGIAPRLTNVNGVSDESSKLNDRIRNLENELKRLQDQIQPNNTEDQKPKRVKREQRNERGSRPHMFAPVEVIDLT